MSTVTRVSTFAAGSILLVSLLYLGSTYVARVFAQPGFSLTSSPGNLPPHASTVPLFPPTHIAIPAIGVFLPIKGANVTGNQWDTYPDSVSWLQTSATPGSSGNIILFGHNLKRLLGSLPYVQIGAKIQLTTDSGSYLYRIVEKIEVDPTDLSLVKNSANRLTIYTCSGAFDSKRFFVIAEPIFN